MAVYTVIARARLDGYAVVQTLTNTDIQPGQSITIASVGIGFNTTATVLFCPEYEYIGTDGDTGEWLYNYERPVANQYLYASSGDDVQWSVLATPGTLTWTQTCTWITAAQIEDYLGIPLTSVDDAAFLTQCAAAANAFSHRRRAESGYYQESLTTSPGGDVTLGTIMVGAAYFRQRGSYNAIASFEGMGIPPANGITPMVMQLLGINRPQVA